MMTIRKVLVATAVLLGGMHLCPSGWAQAPSGCITNQITATNNALWDVSVLFQGLTNNTWAGNLCAFAAKATNDAVQVGFSAPYTVDGRGRLAGKGTNELLLNWLAWESEVYTNWVGQWVTNQDNQGEFRLVEQPATNWFWSDILDASSLPGNYVTRGAVVGVQGKTKFNFSSRASAKVPVDGVTRQMTVTRLFYVLIDDTDLVRGSEGSIIAFSGRRVYAKAGGFAQINPFKQYLGGGAWTLVLNFDPQTATATNRLSGSATVTLNTGAVYPFTFTGRYVPKTGQSILLLKGVKNTAENTGNGDGRGATLSVTLVNGQITNMLGRIAGQTLKQK